MDKNASSDKALAAWHDVIDEMTARFDVTPAQMFGMPSLRGGDGKFFAGLRGDAMTFKLAGPAHAEALALAGAQLFDPSGKRPMKQWVQVPFEHSDRWLGLAAAAAEAAGAR